MSGAGNARLLEESSAYTPGGVHASIRIIDPPLCVRRAEGAYIEDVDGRRYIDYHAAFGPFILGHCYPDVVERVVAAIRQADLYGVSTTELELALSKKVVEHVPSVEQVLLCCTGSEATFHAVRLARAATGRRHLIKFQGCYHGWHDYLLRNVLSAPERVGERDPGSAGMLDEVVDNTLVCDFNGLEGVERIGRARPGQGAAIILDPIPHNLASIPPPPGFPEALAPL